MGKQGDPNAVVDSNGKVYGVSGLRVIDASILPFVAPGHSMAPVCKLNRPVIESSSAPCTNYSIDMLAEKISDDIKNGR